MQFQPGIRQLEGVGVLVVPSRRDLSRKEVWARSCNIYTYAFRNSAVHLFVTPHLDSESVNVRTVYIHPSCYTEVVDDAWLRVVPAVATDSSSHIMAVIMDTESHMREAFWTFWYSSRLGVVRNP